MSNWEELATESKSRGSCKDHSQINGTENVLLHNKDTDLIFTEATSIANALKELPSSCVLHDNSQMSRGEHHLHEHHQQKPFRQSEKLSCRKESRFNVPKLQQKSLQQQKACFSTRPHPKKRERGFSEITGGWVSLLL